MYISTAKVNLFSLQKMRKVHYQVEQHQKIRREWIENESGEYVGSMTEDGEGRAIADCRTLLPPLLPPSLSPSEMLPMEENVDEVMVAVVDIELLHRRMGHIRSVAMKRLGRGDLVCGSEAGVV